MKKEEFVRRYGEAAWKKKMAHKNEKNAIWMKKWCKENLTESRKRAISWKLNNPEKIKKHDQEISRKGGRYYEAAKRRGASGIPNEKRNIRAIHNRQWREYKRAIAPESEVHHSWLNDGTAAYSGVALVEKYQHQHGVIDVIQILEGDITLLTEEEIRGGAKI